MPSSREQLESLIEIYATALDELRALNSPRVATLIVSLESLNRNALSELRYLRASTDAARKLGR